MTKSKFFFLLVSLAFLTLVAACGSKTMLVEGQQVPMNIALKDQTGTVRTLEDFRGNPLVIYFYPRNNTPGCTTEACAFRDVWSKYEHAGIAVVGVSTDSAASHAKFAEEYDLPFTLLADTESALLEAFGGKAKLGFAPRISFLVDEDGVVQATYPNVDPGVHAQQILDDALRLGLASPSLP